MPARKQRSNRQRRRLLVRFRAAGSGDDFRTGFTEDLSREGLFIQTTAGLGRGTRLEMEMETPAGSVRLGGKVRWAKRAPLSLAQKKRSGMGVQVDEMPESLLELIRSSALGATGR